MTQPLDPTQPTSAVDKLEHAIHLVKGGRRTEARDALRRVVAAEPLNQAAWLWLSAVATEPGEAEAALAQARQINPVHPSLPQAEQWLAQRFSTQATTRRHETMTMPVSPPPPQFLVTPEGVVKPLGSHKQTFRMAPLPPAPPPVPMPPESQRLPRIFNFVALAVIIIALLIGLVVLFLGLALEVSATTPEPTAVAPADLLLAQLPQLDAAWAERNWSQAIAILEPLSQTQPDSPVIKERLTHAYLQKGMALRHKGFIEEAVPYFEQALAVTPHQRQAQQELRLASSYLTGVEHYQAGRWAEAIQAFEAVQAEDEAYIHLTDLLYSAYYNHGLALQAAGDLSEARQALEAAIALRPDLPEPRRQIAEIEFALAPQTPLATPFASASVEDKLIVVGIAEQRMWVFEKKKKVFDFVVSTGEPGSDTAIGDFEILDKIDLAYGSNWNLDMPYWMGIYWAGSLENGIHSLPIVRHTGYKLWDGYLGQRVSYGCIILGDADAETLYRWAEVGAKVKIVPSLADWSAE